MDFDRFKPPTYEDAKIFSRCYVCNTPIYIGDEYIHHNERVCCDSRKCIIKATESEIKIAGEDDEV